MKVNPTSIDDEEVTTPPKSTPKHQNTITEGTAATDTQFQLPLFLGDLLLPGIKQHHMITRSR
jgi:hypothetical protein